MIFGIDIASWQKGLDLDLVKEEGYDFCVVKASEGPSQDGWTYTNPLFGSQMAAAKSAGLITGVYHFLLEGPVKPQVDLFMKSVGDPKGKLLMVDFEEYPSEDYKHYTPTNSTLKAFIAELRKRVGKHPILLYSGPSFWDGGEASGNVGDYGDLVTWTASYPTDEFVTDPREYHDEYKDWGWTQGFGGQKPKIWQFTGKGKVANLDEVDVNAFDGTREDLLKLASTVERPLPPAPRPTPEEPKMADRVLKTDAKGYAWDAESSKYVIVPSRKVGAFYTDAKGYPKAYGYMDPNDNLPPKKGNYVDRHPIRYNWRSDVRWLIERIKAEYNVSCNTYYDHPEGWARDEDSFDVWGPKGRGDWVDPVAMNAIINSLYYDPNPPHIEWYIWQRYIYGAWNNWQGEPFGDGTQFTNHEDHGHFTMAR